MARTKKAPARKVAEALPERSTVDRLEGTLHRLRAQLFAARFALPIEVAGMIAAIALGGGGHG